MRIKTLRSLLIALIFVMLDVQVLAIPYIGYDLAPDMLGLPFVLFCCVLLINRAPLFNRPVVISFLLIFLETVRIFHLATDPTVVNVLLLIYLFAKAMLVMSIFNAYSQMYEIMDHPVFSNLAETTGFIYVMIFPLQVGQLFLDKVSGILALSELIIVVFSLVILCAFYAKTLTAIREDTQPQFEHHEEQSEEDDVQPTEQSEEAEETYTLE